MVQQLLPAFHLLQSITLSPPLMPLLPLLPVPFPGHETRIIMPRRGNRTIWFSSTISVGQMGLVHGIRVLEIHCRTPTVMVLQLQESPLFLTTFLSRPIKKSSLSPMSPAILPADTFVPERQHTRDSQLRLTSCSYSNS
jgi:hypothetical protein